QVGRVPLYLLDSDVEENDEAQRAITHQLYGGDSELRIRQEMVLGVGGLRALRRLGCSPSVFHMNEGHAAFLAFERIREEVVGGLDFAAALERTAAGNVFTTHTPVPAGHDRFSADRVRWYLQGLLRQLGCSEEQALALGGSDGGDAAFNMTTLALRASRFYNGVSAIHGGVARRMEQALWPQLPAEENPIGHITNGVHLHTFLAQAWKLVFHDLFRGWRNELLNPGYWSCIDTIPHQRFVAVRQQLKRDLLQDVEQRLCRQLRRNGVSEAVIAGATALVADADSKALVIGFARRFATYKRASLILTDEARLARLLNQPERPVLLLFAGKAHPRDEPGQAIIERLHQASMKPEFLGRLIVLEGYDMLLARNLVQGCDVWLNNPEYPLEASGTSGQKAGINGVVNVSVLDGWWDEGYDGSNGFAIRPVDPLLTGGSAPLKAALRRDQEESRQMLDILERQVLPLYFGAGDAGYDPAWIRLARNSMKSLIPRFNSARMVMDYLRSAYAPAARQARKLGEEGGLAARELSEWKQRVRECWGRVGLRLAHEPQRTLRQGERLVLEVLADLDGLEPQEVVVECLLSAGEEDAAVASDGLSCPFAPAGAEGASFRYRLDLRPLSGLQHYRIRMRPMHAALSHPLELGLLVWL
ncbi:MAG: alpha-glucan family phosphorylase, partial [Nevskia sp.]|nr:alpha-glucan family phosphorylase [Nevskia sp.]